MAIVYSLKSYIDVIGIDIVRALCPWNTLQPTPCAVICVIVKSTLFSQCGLAQVGKLTWKHFTISISVLVQVDRQSADCLWISEVQRVLDLLERATQQLVSLKTCHTVVLLES